MLRDCPEVLHADYNMDVILRNLKLLELVSIYSNRGVKRLLQYLCFNKVSILIIRVGNNLPSPCATFSV